MIWRSNLAIMAIQFRLLANNPSACAILVTISMAALLLGRPAAPTLPATCYVVYWQEDEWVQHLRTRLPSVADLKIELVPVSRFADASGLISYPNGAHSIQMRPPQGDADAWTIWCWYSGSQPDAMTPATKWFWDASQEFWRDQLSCEVRLSALKPTNAVHQLVGLTGLPALPQPENIAPMILILALFFCTAYLQAMHLALQIHDHVLDTVLTKPISAGQWARSCVGFHLALAVLVSLPAMICHGWLGLPGAWCTVLLVSCGYTGAAFTVATYARSLVSSNSLLMVFGLVSVLSFAASHVFPNFPIGQLSAEWSSFQLLQSPVSESLPWLWMTLVVWALIWSLLGHHAFCRWARQ